MEQSGARLLYIRNIIDMRICKMVFSDMTDSAMAVLDSLCLLRYARLARVSHISELSKLYL
jgi:hypothetical protein